MGRGFFDGVTWRGLFAALGLGAAVLAAPTAALALSPACTAINNNEKIATGNNTNNPAGISGTYRVAADGLNWDGNFSNYNKVFAAGEVISWSYSTSQGTPYVHVTRLDFDNFYPRADSALSRTGASGSGSMTILAGQETDYINVAVTDYPIDSTFNQSGPSEPARRNTATSITLSCGPGGSPTPSLSSFSYGSTITYNAGGASGTSINVASGGGATQSPTGYTVSNAAGGSFGASSATSGGGTVSINSAGVATYTPRAGYRGGDTFYAKASNGSGPSSAATVTVTVGNPSLSAALTGSGAKRGVALSGYAVTPSGGAAPYGCTLNSGSSLPSGVALGANCALSGTPTSSGTFSFNVDVTDSSVTGANGGTAAAFTQASVAISNFAIAQATPSVTGVSPSSGPTTGGTSVVLTGSDFAGATAVTFDGTPVGGFNVDSPTQISTSSPAHAAGTINIVVTTAGGASATGVANQFTYTTPVPPTVTVSPAAGALSGAVVGASYSATVTAGGASAPYSFAVTAGSLPAGVVLSSSGALSGAPSQAGDFSFTVTATDDTASGAGGPYSGSAAYTLHVGAATVTLNPGALPGATTGAAYSQTVTASGGVAAYSYAVTAGALPAGLSLSSGGVLSGSPTAAGTFNVTITATDSATGTGAPFSGAQAYSLVVAAPTITVGPTVLTDGAIGVAYSQAVSASGGVTPYSYAVTAGALPAGLSLAANGTLSGTPTAGGAFNFTVTASDSATGSGPFTGARGYTLTISAPTLALAPSSLPAGAVGISYSQSVSATGGVSPYSYAVTAGALPGGLSLSASTGEISGAPTANGAFNFTITATDSATGSGPYTASQGYTLTIAAPTITVTPGSLPTATPGAAYSQTLTASGGAAPYGYAVTAGALPAGLTLSAGGVLSGAPTASGTFNFTVTATDSAAAPGPYTGSAAYTLSVGAATLTLAPSSLASGAMGASYSQSVSATGGVAPYSYAITAGALPAGLTLSASTGEISGAPTTSGTFNFTITATDSATGSGPFTASQGYTLAIAAPTISVASGSLPTATPGAAYSQTLTASGGTAPYGYVVTAGALPAGLTLSAGGMLSGAPTASGTFNFTVTATDSAGAPGPYTGSAAYTLTVGAATLSLAPATFSNGEQGVAYSQTLTASGGVAPYSYAVTAGVLPAGVTLSSSGLLTGTPTVSGAFNVTITATDASTGAGPYTIGRSYTLTIAAPPEPPVVEPPVTEPPVVNPPVTPPVITPPAPVTSPETGAPQGPATVSLPATTTGEVTRYEIEQAPSQGQAILEAPTVGGGTDWRLVYTPVSSFMGEATVQVVAVGPGGKSAPANFVFRVSGKAPDLNGIALSGQPLVFEPTKTLTGGPFQSLRITRQPDSGSARVVGLTIVYTADGASASASSSRKAPGAMASIQAEGGSAAALPSLDYVVVLPFGDSSPGRIDIQAVAGPALTPLTAGTLAGRPVTVSLTDTATGGPFTAAQIVSVTSGVGSATLIEHGAAGARTYDLVFTPQGAFTGEAVVAYRLSNAAASTQGVLTVTVTPRPDPSLDPDVRGVTSAELDSARRFARAQTDNFHRRLEQVRRGGGWSNGVRLNVAADGPDEDPKVALRRQLGLPDIEGDARPAAVPRALDVVAGLADAAPHAAPGRTPGRGGVSTVGVWTAGGIDWGRRDARGQRDYRFSTSGVSGGVDWKLSERLVLGLGAGYGLDRTKVGSNGSLSRGESYVGAVYGGWRGEGSLAIDGVLGYGSLAYDSRRWSADAGKALLGERSGSVLFGSASVALEQTRKALSWSPYARVQFSTIELDRFTERGSDIFALNYRDLESRSLSSVLGASFDWAQHRHTGDLAANLRFEWRHEFEGADDQVVSYADWAASPDYVVGLERWARDSVSLATGLEWRSTSGWRFGSDYNGEIGSDFVRHGLRIKVLKGF